MRYWIYSIAILLLAPAASGQNWNENNGKREWAQAPRTKVMVSHELEMISWPGLPDSTYFKIDIGSITDSIWYSGDTTTIGISEYFHARFYNVGGDMLEWEAILYQKPGNQFSWTFPIEHNNLDFLYQGELTQDEIDHGAYRPDSVVGSYSVYHLYKAWNQYKNGKAFHIYRPKAWDSAGDTVWLDLDINTVANELTISGNRQWFRDAVYPVTIDPIFGFNSIGASSIGVNNTWTYAVTWSADYHTASTGDIVDSLWFYGRSANASGDSTKMAIYDVDAGQPENKLMESGLFGATSTNGWYGIGISQSLTNAVIYTLAVGEFTTGTWFLFYDAETNAGSENGSTFPDPWVSGNSDWRFSMYAVYTAGGAPAAVSPRRRKIPKSFGGIDEEDNITLMSAMVK